MIERRGDEVRKHRSGLSRIQLAWGRKEVFEVGLEAAEGVKLTEVIKLGI